MSDPIASAADRFAASEQITGASAFPVYRTAARFGRVANIGEMRSLVIHPAPATHCGFPGAAS